MLHKLFSFVLHVLISVALLTLGYHVFGLDHQSPLYSFSIGFITGAASNILFTAMTNKDVSQ